MERTRTEAIVEALDAPGRPWLLLFDFDGTLAEFAPTPELARLPVPRRALLTALAARPRVTVGFVSGRRLDDLRQRLKVEGPIFLSGMHGQEIVGPDCSFRHPALNDAREALSLVRPLLANGLSGMRGVILEDKGVSLAVHWRQASPDDHALVERLVLELARASLDRRQLRLMRGKAICELLPATPWNKGDAAHWIRERVAERLGEPPAVLYAGDDITDEDAIVALGASAVTVAVGDRPSAARFQLDDPQAVERLLERLVDCAKPEMAPA